VKLIDTQTGGTGGGGARLTREGAEYVKRFQQFSRGLDELVKDRFREAFEGTQLE
jgi:molybdate transport repressor ModE-like protein